MVLSLLEFVVFEGVKSVLNKQLQYPKFLVKEVLNVKQKKKKWPWSTEWIGAKAKRVLPRKCTSHRKHPLPTTQEMTLHMDITRWSIPKSDGLHPLQPKIEKLYTDSKNKTRSWLWLRSWTPYCKIQTKLKKVGKTTKPFRYDLNQIPYDYIVEMTNRFKGLELVDSMPEELWMDVCNIV